MRVEIAVEERLVAEVADPPAQLPGLARQLVAEHRDRALGRPQQGRDDPQQRRLPRPVRAEDREGRAGRQLQGEVAQHPALAVGEAELRRLDRGRGGGLGYRIRHARKARASYRGIFERPSRPFCALLLVALRELEKGFWNQRPERARSLAAGALADSQGLVDAPLRSVRQARHEKREDREDDADGDDSGDEHFVLPPSSWLPAGVLPRSRERETGFHGIRATLEDRLRGPGQNRRAWRSRTDATRAG